MSLAAVSCGARCCAAGSSTAQRASVSAGTPVRVFFGERRGHGAFRRRPQARPLPRLLSLTPLGGRGQRRLPALITRAEDPLSDSALKTAEADRAAMPLNWLQVFPPFFFPALGGVLFGYDIGATSGALISLKDPALSGIDWFSQSATATGLVVSGSLAGALLGSASAFLVADPLGRRRELILAAFLYAAGAACTAGASSFPALLIGRLTYGLGIGLAMHAAPMYIAETSPAGIRGTLISLKEAFIVGGILLGYVSGSAFVGDAAGWREIFGCSVPLAALMAAGMWWLPPSPRWLLLQYSLCTSPASSPSAPPPPSAPLLYGLLDKGSRDAYRERAVAALQRLRGPAVSCQECEREVEGILSAQEGGSAHGSQGGESEGIEERGGGQERQRQEEPSLGELLSGTNAVALRVAGGLVVFQQITGQPSVLYYAASILQDAGFPAAADATKVSVVLGIFKLLMTGVAVLLVDKAGRRPLLLSGVSGLVLSLFLLGTVYQGELAAPFLSVAALLLYVGAYQVSFGPISWLMVSEIFTLRVRGRAQSIATLLNFGSNAVVTFALPPLQEKLGQALTFYSFGVVGVAALAFVFFFVPETKGLTLEEIQRKLDSESLEGS